MFPTLRQRLIIVAAVALGAACWMLVLPTLRAHDGGSGVVLLTGEWGESVQRVALIALAGLPAVALGVVASATGNPMSGFFAVGGALGVLAWVGGPIDGVLRRAAAADALPDRYATFMIEMLVWQAGVLAMAWLVQRFRSPMRTRWPALAFDDHLGVDTHYRMPELQGVLAGLLAAVIAWPVAYVVLRSTDVGQVFWGLVIAFMLGSLIAHVAVPHNNLVGILFAPALTALATYGWVLTRYGDTEDVLHAWFNLNQSLAGSDRIVGPALALPIFYASAGLMGCALGVGWAQVIVGSASAAVEAQSPKGA